MENYISKEITKRLENLAQGLTFKTQIILTGIEDEFIGKILITKDKRLIALTSLPWVREKLDNDIDILKEIYYVKCKKCTTTTGKVDIMCGNLQPKIFVIGIAPSCTNVNNKNGYNRSMSFGKIAKYIRGALIRLDIHDKTWYTNVIKCSVPDNRKVLLGEVMNCTFWLNKELQYLKPKVLIFLGKDAECFFDYAYDLNLKKIMLHHPASFMYKNKSYEDYHKYVFEQLKDIKEELS